MKLRNTIIMLLLVAGMLAYIKWVDKGKPSTSEKQDSETKPFTQVDQDKISRVTIRSRDIVMQLTQQDNVWTIESPLKDRAQEFDVKSMLGGLDLLTLIPVARKAPTREQLKDYGLLKPEFSVKVEGDRTVEISLGSETVLEGTYYIKVEGRDLVYTARTSVREYLARKPNEWRSRTLTDVFPQNVRKVGIKTPKGEIEIGKAGRYWSISKPLKARADAAIVADLLANALTAQVQEFLSDSKDLAAFGLNEPRATLTFTADDAESPVVLEIGAAKVVKKEEGDKKEEPKVAPATPAAPKKPEPPAPVYVRISGRAGIFTVPGSIEKLIQLQPNDLRDRNIMRIQDATANLITIESPGKEKVVLEKVFVERTASEEWVRRIDSKKSVPANSGVAAKLLADLSTGKVSRFVADLASDLKGFGLDQPQITVTISDYSSEGTPESNAGEREQAKLLIGRMEADAGYAKLADEPFIFAVPTKLIDDLWTDPIRWQSLRINDIKHEDIVAIEIERTGQMPMSLVADGAKGWKLAKGDGTLNQNAVKSLVNTIADLRAVRWAGATDPAAHGMEKPNLVVTYTLADKSITKLKIGSMSRDEMWHASLENLAGTFLMPAGDFDALNAALIETPKPAKDNAPPSAGDKPSATPPKSLPAAVPPTAEPKSTEPARPTEAPAAGPKPAAEPPAKP